MPTTSYPLLYFPVRSITRNGDLEITLSPLLRKAPLGIGFISGK